MHKKKMLDHVLEFDPIAAVEEITGKPVEDDSEGALLAVSLAFQRTQWLQTNALLRNDTTLSCTVEKYLRIVKSMGFEEVFSWVFDDPAEYSEATQDTVTILANFDASMLLTMESHQTNRVNSAHLFFQWKPHSESDYPGGMGGSWEIPGVERPWLGDEHKTPRSQMYFVGNTDARAHIRHTVEQLLPHMMEWYPSNVSHMYGFLVSRADYKEWHNSPNPKAASCDIIHRRQMERLEHLPERVRTHFKLVTK